MNETSASALGSKEETQKEVTNTVPFYKLFAFADSADKLLMLVGTIGAVGNGVSLPLMTILFGQLIDSFGQNQSKDVVSVVSKVLPLRLPLPLSLFLHFLFLIFFRFKL